MLFQLRNKSNFCQDLVKRTLIHRNVATTCVKLTGRPAKSFNQSDFDRVHRRKFDKFQKEIEEKSSEDPFSPVKYFVKALTYGFILATICSISYGEASVLLYFIIISFNINILGAFDPGYRKVLRTTYPLAAHVLDLLMEKEEDIVLHEEKIFEKAAIIREELKKTSE